MNRLYWSYRIFSREGQGQSVSRLMQITVFQEKVMLPIDGVGSLQNNCDKTAKKIPTQI